MFQGFGVCRKLRRFLFLRSVQSVKKKIQNNIEENRLKTQVHGVTEFNGI